MHAYYIFVEIHENNYTWNFKEIVPSKRERRLLLFFFPLLF